MDVEGPTTHGTFLVMCRSVPPADNWVGEYRTRPWEELDRFDRSSPAVDCVLLTVDQGSLCVLIHRRQNEPELGSWALPGSFVNPGPTYEAEVLRTLEKKAGLSFPEGPPYLEQLASWNQPNRDPRGWVITVAYLVLAPAAAMHLELDNQPGVALAPIRVPWKGEKGGAVQILLPDGQSQLALGHNELVSMAVLRLRGKLRYTPIALALMPKRFPLRDLKVVYDIISGSEWDRGSFRRHVETDMKWVKATKSREPASAGHRPAALYRRA